MSEYITGRVPLHSLNDKSKVMGAVTPGPNPDPNPNSNVMFVTSAQLKAIKGKQAAVKDDGSVLSFSIEEENGDLSWVVEEVPAGRTAGIRAGSRLLGVHRGDAEEVDGSVRPGMEMKRQDKRGLLKLYSMEVLIRIFM